MSNELGAHNERSENNSTLPAGQDNGGAQVVLGVLCDDDGIMRLAQGTSSDGWPLDEQT